MRSIYSLGVDGPMTANKLTIRKYMDAFSKSNHADILSCLTDDVEWVIPGMFHVTGKAAFDKEIENDAFVGSPTITVTRMIEEGDVVVAEGRMLREKGRQCSECRVLRCLHVERCEDSASHLVSDGSGALGKPRFHRPGSSRGALVEPQVG